jgi:CHAD domain-containing protein
VWPGPLEQFQQEAKTLSDLLGDDHDLAVLGVMMEHACTSDRGGVSSKVSEHIKNLLHRKRSRLQGEAFPLGKRLFAEKPPHIQNRFARYWEVWRSGERYNGNSPFTLQAKNE